MFGLLLGVGLGVRVVLTFEALVGVMISNRVKVSGGGGFGLLLQLV